MIDDTNITNGDIPIEETIEDTSIQSDNTELFDFLTENFLPTKEQFFLDNGTFITFINQFSLGELVISVLLFLILIMLIIKIVYEVIFN